MRQAPLARPVSTPHNDILRVWGPGTFQAHEGIAQEPIAPAQVKIHVKSTSHKNV